MFNTLLLLICLGEDKQIESNPGMLGYNIIRLKEPEYLYERVRVSHNQPGRVRLDQRFADFQFSELFSVRAISVPTTFRQIVKPAEFDSKYKHLIQTNPPTLLETKYTKP